MPLSYISRFASLFPQYEQCFAVRRRHKESKLQVLVSWPQGFRRPFQGRRWLSEGVPLVDRVECMRPPEALVRVEAGERDGLVADEAGASVDHMRVPALGLEVGLGADTKKLPAS